MWYTRGWLNYRQMEQIRFPFEVLYVQNDSVIMKTAANELIGAVKELTKTRLICISDIAEINAAQTKISSSAIFLETEKVGKNAKRHRAGAYRISMEMKGMVISGSDENGVLYGVFEFIRQLQTGSANLAKLINRKLVIEKTPKNPLRMFNHWDNLDGSIERGYAGDSFFFQENEILVDERTRAYARLLASIGINGTVINNVNVRQAATWLITDRYLPKLRAMSDIFQEYGISLYLSLNFAAPMELGGLTTCDPAAANVQDFWKKKMQEVYRAIPELGGFLVKADSEGRPGPFTYGRTHAEGANMLARAVKPYGGRIIWRCFVYNCAQDWRDRTTDRAKAAYDNFMPLDGQFLDNVILQIKNGPMDFQVREPVSPLFSGLERTNQMLEVQAAQEYTGQQKHLCYLVPMWKEILSFRTYAKEEHDTVADIVSGECYGQTSCGMAAVANTGSDENWCGHDLAAANFYGFGRLAFDTELTAEEIAREWICGTYGTQPELVNVLLGMLMDSWSIYESYTSPLGIGWMVNPSHHYGPNVDGYEYDRWGTYHRSDCHGMGVDRTTKGTGFTSQYREPNAQMYENLSTCPEELLLFFHHVPYTYPLKSGKTLIQHIYDSHFEGAKRAQYMLDAFCKYRQYLEDDVYERIVSRLKIQSDHAKEWRDRINTYYFRMSGIPDEHGRTIY